MPDVGHLLQEAREQKRVTLEDVERELKIRRKFLVALENDQRNHVLDQIYMRGFLKNYARYLGLDPAEIMRLYDDGVPPPSVLPPPAPPPRPALKPPLMAAPLAPPPAAEPEPTAAVAPKPAQIPPHRASVLRFLPVGAVALVLMIGVMGGAFKLVTGGAVGEALRMVSGVGAMPPANATAVWAKTAVLQPGKVSAAPQSTPTPKPSPTITLTPSVTPTPTITPTPTPIIYTGVDIELVVSDRAWLQVTADGQKVFEGILEAGQRRSWHGNDKVQVRCGNGGGVEALVNGLSMGKLGEMGQVVDNEWLKESVPAVTPAAPAGSAISNTTTLTETAPVSEASPLPTNTPPMASPTPTVTPGGPVSINVVPVGSSNPVTGTAPVSPTAKQ